jgi:hypothetical protein
MSQIKVDTITDEAGTGAPEFPNGAVLNGAITGTALSSTPDAEAGTGTGLMNSTLTAQAIAAQVPLPIGVGQTPQNLTGSRSAGTSYQNTTGRPIYVHVSMTTSAGTRRMQLSANNSTWVDVSALDTTNGIPSGSFIVPDGYYYRIIGTVSILVWAELR